MSKYDASYTLVHVLSWLHNTLTLLSQDTIVKLLLFATTFTDQNWVCPSMFYFGRTLCSTKIGKLTETNAH